MIRSLLGKLNHKHSLWWYLGSLALTALSVFIIWRLIAQNLDAILSIREGLEVWPLLLTAPVFFAGEYVAALAWRRIMNDLAAPLPPGTHERIYIITRVANRLPGSVWHVVGRIFWYERLGIRKPVTTLANVLDIVLTLWAGLINVFILSPLFTREARIPVAWFGLGILLSAALMHPRVIGKIVRRMAPLMPPEALTYRRILIWLTYYLGLWWVGGAVLYLTLRALYPAPLSMLPFCTAVASLGGVAGMSVLLLPSGLGVTEATMSLALERWVPAGLGVSAAIIDRILLTLYEFLFALLLLGLSRRTSLGAGLEELKQAAAEQQAQEH